MQEYPSRHWPLLRQLKLYWVLKSAFANIHRGLETYRHPAASLAPWKSIYLPEFHEQCAPYFCVLDSLLADFCDLANEHAFSPYVLILPERLQVSPADQKIAFSILDAAPWNFQEPMEIVMDRAADHDLRAHNLLPDFLAKSSPERLYYKFDKHLNLQGHLVVATTLLKQLKPLLFDGTESAERHR